MIFHSYVSLPEGKTAHVDRSEAVAAFVYPAAPADAELPYSGCRDAADAAGGPGHGRVTAVADGRWQAVVRGGYPSGMSKRWQKYGFMVVDADLQWKVGVT